MRRLQASPTRHRLAKMFAAEEMSAMLLQVATSPSTTLLNPAQFIACAQANGRTPSIQYALSRSTFTFASIRRFAKSDARFRIMSSPVSGWLLQNNA
jgi:hypothetical protein